MADDVVIMSAVRTPIGKFGRNFKTVSAVQLGTIAARAAILRSGVDPTDIQQAIFGTVLQAGLGQNLARQVSLNAGLDVRSTAMTVNQVCGSSLKAIRLGQAAILMGDADAVLVGGAENMSQAPYLDRETRWGHKMGDYEMTDSLLSDGLMDAFNQVPMGITAENVATEFQVSRAEQDALALRSQENAVRAQAEHRFDAEIVPVTVGDHVVAVDEAVRADTSLAKLAALKPAFKADGTVTAGNAAGLNDGAAAMVLMRKSAAEAAGLPYLAVIKNYQESGIDPALMGYAPTMAIRRVLDRQHWTVADLDRIELNEAFAAQSVAVSRDLQLPVDKLNVNGGSIALGHPLGASGTRIVVTLLHELIRTDGHRGLASMCIGGGMGMALLIERP
ncbi:thiolase family protein [Levilactobacillus zymae]|uniref:acetyl-CoA C-acetyltransferase n=1 Tax=Levilactobacillus zymae TaxID=267363 RepID=A0A1Y6K225_9LACO|nr:acetyl-CoA C-acetyltransferase [Levilactobacillus zymae]SMS15421.1 3-ketoacyl-CoA thiolase / Acetyl-CoA acetyltransferase [Levilactobacillus zymae]